MGTGLQVRAGAWSSSSTGPSTLILQHDPTAFSYISSEQCGSFMYRVVRPYNKPFHHRYYKKISPTITHTHTHTHTHTQTHTQKPQFNSFGERVLWHQSWPDNHRETPSILTSTNSIYPFTTHPRPFDRVYLFDSESIPSQFRASSFWFAFFCLVWFFFSNLLLAFLENCSIVLWHQPQPDNREGKIYIYIYIYSS